MTISTKLRSVLATAGVTLGAAGLVVGTSVAASALTYSPDPFSDGNPITVTSTSTTLPAGTYRVGICTVATFSGVPACGAQTNVPGFAGGQLTGVVTPAVFEFGNANAHFGVPGMPPGQPSTFDCDDPTDCVVVITRHSGSSSVTVESEPLR